MSIIEMSIAGGLMIIAAAVFRLLCMGKLPKRVFALIWEIILLRLLLPVSVPLPILPAPDLTPTVPQKTEPTYHYEEKVFPYETGLFDLSVPHSDSTYKPAEQPESVKTETEPETVKTEAPKKSLKIPKISLTAFSTAVSALIAVYFLAAYFIGIRRFRDAVPADSDYIRDWLKKRKIHRKVSVKYCRTVTSPLTYGILRPIILLPKSLDGADSLDYVLEHEYAHIRHYDSLKKLVATAVLCVHWFNPLVWLMYRLYNADMELWCDEAVIKKFGAKSKASYARALINIEEMKGFAPMVSFIRKNAVEKRIISIMKFKKGGFMTTALAVLLVASTTVTVIATSIEPVPRKADTPTESEPVVSPSLPYIPDFENISDSDESKPEVQSVSAGSTMIQIHDIFTDNETAVSDQLYFKAGELGAVIIDLGRQPTDEEFSSLTARANLNGQYTSTLYDITSKTVKDTKVVFIFSAPRDGDFSFSCGNMSNSGILFSEKYVVAKPAATENEFIFAKDIVLTLSDVASADVDIVERHPGCRTLYERDNLITDCRLDGRAVEPSDSNLNRFSFSAGEKAVICVDFGHEPLPEEYEFDILATCCPAETNESRLFFRLETVFSDSGVLKILFEALFDEDYSFVLINYSKKWLYVKDLYIEKESRVVHTTDDNNSYFGDFKIPNDIHPDFYVSNLTEILNYYHAYDDKSQFFDIITPETITDGYLYDEEVNYVQVGERFSDFYSFVSEDERFSREEGVRGLYYTVDNYKIYDSYKDCGIEEEKFFGKTMLRKFGGLKLVVIEMTAEYHKPTGSDADEILPVFTWGATYRHGEEYKYPDVEYPPNKLTGIVQAFFIDEADTSSEPDSLFKVHLKDGEKRKLLVGYFVSDNFLEAKNFYLFGRPYMKSCVGQPNISYIDILGRMS